VDLRAGCGRDGEKKKYSHPCRESNPGHPTRSL